MRIFVTGATGFVGTAVVRELIGAGYQVVGLARSDGAAASIAAAGADVHHGDLDDPDSLRGAAAAADGVVHTAFVHDFGNLGAAGETDRRAIEAIGGALAGSGRPFVVTSAMGLLTPGRVATEEDAPDPRSHAVFRIASEEAALSLATRGVRASVLRLPVSVHGAGDTRGFVPAVIRTARATGVAAYVGDGLQRWPAVHRLDAARLFRLALEGAPAGTRLHAVADEGVRVRDIAGVIGRHLGLPVTAEAGAHFGWLAPFVALDIPASSVLTRGLLGWQPVGPGLLADLDEGHYFAGSDQPAVGQAG